MRATAEPVEKNKVRLSVEVDETEFGEVLDDVVRSLTRQARVPGFRPGKVPRRVLEARMGGAGALRAEALREALPDFYARAVADVDVDPIAAPEIDVTSGEEAGPIAFNALVEVRPTVNIPVTRVWRSRCRPWRSARRTWTPRSTASARRTPSWSR